MARRSVKFLGRTLATVWMLASFNAVCLASKELNISTESGKNSTAEANESGLPPEFLRPFATAAVSETPPCKGENCHKGKGKGKVALATEDDVDASSKEVSEHPLATPSRDFEDPTEECFLSLYPYLKRLGHLKKAALAGEMVQSMKEKNIVKAILLPLYGLSLNAAYNDGDVDEDPMGINSTLLHWTAYHDAIEHTEMMILKGADVNSENSRFFSPLHVAAWYGRTAIAEIFLLAGTNANSAARHSWTPLYVAAREGHLDVVKILLISGSDPNSRSLVGWTPLHVAAWKGYLDICEVLVDAGAMIDTRAYSGELPLNHICKSFQSSCSDRTQNALKELLTP